jgi:predicted small secreted protein
MPEEVASFVPASMVTRDADFAPAAAPTAGQDYRRRNVLPVAGPTLARAPARLHSVSSPFNPLAHRLPREIANRRGGRSMRHLKLLSIVLLAMSLLAACSTTERTAGENFDDATITAEVKAKLAREKLGTLTSVDVDTNLRTVYLNGVVESEEMKQRAASIALSVKGVQAVVNNLSIKTTG